MKKLIEPYHRIAIVGLTKNCGKTTTLNTLLDWFSNEKIGLSSIGLDGEAMDQITFLPKPRIIAKPHMLIATAEQCLKDTDTPHKVVKTTRYETALGKIVYVRTEGVGPIVVAGPTTNRLMNQVIQTLKSHTHRVFVDGAFNRMTFANLTNLDALILATGASLSKDMHQTVIKTAHAVRLFTLTKHPVFHHKPNHAMALIKTNGVEVFSEKNIALLEPYAETMKTTPCALYIRGALTKKWVEFFKTYRIENVDLIADDPTKYLLDMKSLKHLDILNIRPYVINPLNLLAVTINPKSPNGMDYDPDEFLITMRKAIKVPVYNILSEGVRNG